MSLRCSYHQEQSICPSDQNSNLSTGIKLQCPSNWLKQEAGLVLHFTAASFLIHTDVHDRMNSTFAELDIRIYVPNATTTSLSEFKQINTHQNEVILNSYKDPIAQSEFLVLRTLDKKLGLEELQVWSVIPTQHILVEVLYLADLLDYSWHIPVTKKIMQSLEITI